MPHPLGSALPHRLQAARQQAPNVVVLRHHDRVPTQNLADPLTMTGSLSRPTLRQVLTLYWRPVYAIAYD